MSSFSLVLAINTLDRTSALRQMVGLTFNGIQVLQNRHGPESEKHQLQKVPWIQSVPAVLFFDLKY